MTIYRQTITVEYDVQPIDLAQGQDPEYFVASGQKSGRQIGGGPTMMPWGRVLTIVEASPAEKQPEPVADADYIERNL